MELLVAAVVGVFVIAVAVLIQAGLVMLATGYVADQGSTFPQSLAVVVIANVASLGLQVAMELVATGGSALFVLPISLIVWGGAISGVTGIRFGQAVFSAILMTVFQCLLGGVLMVSAGSWLALMMPAT